MKTKAVRLYGEMDLRLDEFELPEMQDDELMYVQLQSNHPGTKTQKSTR